MLLCSVLLALPHELGNSKSDNACPQIAFTAAVTDYLFVSSLKKDCFFAGLQWQLRTVAFDVRYVSF